MLAFFGGAGPMAAPVRQVPSAFSLLAVLAIEAAASGSNPGPDPDGQSALDYGEEDRLLK